MSSSKDSKDSKDSSSDRPGKHPLPKETSQARGGGGGRAESKARLENIERDISYLRETVGSLLRDLRQAVPVPVPAPAPAPSASASSQRASRRRERRRLRQAQAAPDQHAQPDILQAQRPQQPLPTLATSSQQLPHRTAIAPQPSWWEGSDGSDANLGPISQPPFPISAQLLPTTLAAPTFPMAPFTSALAADAFISQSTFDHAVLPFDGQQLLMDCHCGKQHESQDECVELIIYSLISSATASAPGYKAPIPRNPAVTELLLQTTSKASPLSAAVSSIAQQYQAKDIATGAALFFLLYRMFRWRMHPSPEYLDDVPILMRPTESQTLIPHPISVDLLPWPGLREYLCANQTGDTRHSVQMYAASVWFAWPESKDLVSTDVTGNMALHPEFEARAGDVTNWRLGPPFTDLFPHLLQYAN